MNAKDTVGLELATPEHQRESARGTLVGLLCGDALGSQVEFMSEARIATRYPDGVKDIEGSPVWGTQAGQPTDDGELALVLSASLVEHQGFNAPSVLNSYQAWLESKPFDVGTTTLAGLVNRHDYESQSNGALMRVAPIGIAYARAGHELAGMMAMMDAGLTHPNPACLGASALVASVVATAIMTTCPGRELYEHHLESVRRAESGPGAELLIETMTSSARTLPHSYHDDMGSVTIALGNAMYWLARETDLEEALTETVRRGGDTDTNAAVCGAVLGAVHGQQAIPQRWQKAVLECRPDGLGATRRPRPQQYWPWQADRLAERVLESGPAGST